MLRSYSAFFLLLSITTTTLWCSEPKDEKQSNAPYTNLKRSRSVGVSEKRLKKNVARSPRDNTDSPVPSPRVYEISSNSSPLPRRQKSSHADKKQNSKKIEISPKSEKKITQQSPRERTSPHQEHKITPDRYKEMVAESAGILSTLNTLRKQLDTCLDERTKESLEKYPELYIWLVVELPRELQKEYMSASALDAQIKALKNKSVRKS